MQNALRAASLSLVILPALALGGCTTPRVKVQPSEAVMAARAHHDVATAANCAARPLSEVSPALVGFAFEETQLTALTTEALAAPLAWLSCHPQARVAIKPDADNHGSDQQQNAIAQKRAEAVRAYLQAHGVDPGRIRMLARSDAEPAGEHLLIRAEGRRW